MYSRLRAEDVIVLKVEALRLDLTRDVSTALGLVDLQSLRTLRHIKDLDLTINGLVGAQTDPVTTQTVSQKGSIKRRMIDVHS